MEIKYQLQPLSPYIIYYRFQRETHSYLRKFSTYAYAHAYNEEKYVFAFT